MAQYTLTKFIEGSACGELRVADSVNPSPWVLKAAGQDPRMMSVYFYRGNELDGNVTLRIYEFDSNQPLAEAASYAMRVIDSRDY